MGLSLSWTTVYYTIFGQFSSVSVGVRFSHKRIAMSSCKILTVGDRLKSRIGEGAKLSPFGFAMTLHRFLDGFG